MLYYISSMREELANSNHTYFVIVDQASWLIGRYGVRNVGLVGVCTSGASLILSSWTTKNLGGLIFLQGIMFGLASGTLFMVSKLYYSISAPCPTFPPLSRVAELQCRLPLSRSRNDDFRRLTLCPANISSGNGVWLLGSPPLEEVSEGLSGPL